jgi:hypothetical protein
MSSHEDLFDNPFFQLLKRKYTSIYAQVESQCFTVCVPTSTALPPQHLLQNITKHIVGPSRSHTLPLHSWDAGYFFLFFPSFSSFLRQPINSSLLRVLRCFAWSALTIIQYTEQHILVPSKFFAGVYHVLDHADEQVEIDRDKIFKSGGGKANPHAHLATILFDELFYNKEYQSYRVLCVDRPLVPLDASSLTPALSSSSSSSSLPLLSPSSSSSNLRQQQQRGNTTSGEEVDEYSSLVTQLSSATTLQQCDQVLTYFPENAIVLRKMRSQQIEPFVANLSKSVARGKELGAVRSIPPLIEDVVDQLVCANVLFRKLMQQPQHFQTLELVVETWVMGNLSTPLTHVLAERCFVAADEALYHAALQHQHLSPVDAGVRDELFCPDYDAGSISSDPLGTSPSNVAAMGVDSNTTPNGGAAPQVWSDMEFAVNLLQHPHHGLDSPTLTPLEKLRLVTNVVSAIKQGVLLAQHRKQLLVVATSSSSSGLEYPSSTTQQQQQILPPPSAGRPDSAFITTDDLIPLITYVLITAKLRFLHTALFLMQHYVFSPMSTSELGFNLVSFCAAAEHLKSGRLLSNNMMVGGASSSQHSSNLISSTDRMLSASPASTDIDHHRSLNRASSFAGRINSSSHSGNANASTFTIGMGSPPARTVAPFDPTSSVEPSRSLSSVSRGGARRSLVIEPSHGRTFGGSTALAPAHSRTSSLDVQRSVSARQLPHHRSQQPSSHVLPPPTNHRQQNQTQQPQPIIRSVSFSSSSSSTTDANGFQRTRSTVAAPDIIATPNMTIPATVTTTPEGPDFLKHLRSLDSGY